MHVLLDVMYAKAPGASSFSIAGVSVTNADGTYDFADLPRF